jgi:dTDP-4-amino-4,6-dideoxygalactose transaminase
MTDKPAILGGKPVLDKPLPPTNTMGAEEIEASSRAIKTGILSGFIGIAGPPHLGGPEVLKLEQWFKDKFGVKHAIGLNSATTALQAMLTGVDIGAGDEVIVPPYTMCATATAVLCCNAIPIFADIDPQTFNMDPVDVERKITPKTKAILTVNLFGQAADLDALQKIADKHNIPLLEDNAQSPGAKYKGKWTGTIGKASVFSLNQNKTVHCGEGGVVLTDDDRIAHRVQLVRNHGEVIMDHLRLQNPGERYEALLGNNFRLVEPLAAIAHEQMKKLDRLTAPRVELAEYLTQQLRQFDCLTPPHIPEGNTHVYFLYAMKFDAKKAGMSRAAFVKALQAENLPVGPGYIRPIYMYPLYQEPAHKCAGPFAYGKPDYPKGLCPVTEKLWFEELVTTNICRYPHTKEHVDLFVKGIAKVLAAKNELAVLKL